MGTKGCCVPNVVGNFWIVNGKTASRATVKPHFMTRIVRSKYVVKHNPYVCIGFVK